MATTGIYIYGIVPNFYETEFFHALITGVDFVSYQNIIAIIDCREIACIDFCDRVSLAKLLVHHQKTIEEIMAIGLNMILPMKLGTMVSNKEDVLKILEKGYDLIVDTLKKIEYLTEIDLAVTWSDFSRTLQEIGSHPDIVALKEDLLKKEETLLQIDQVKVGMLIHEKLIDKNKLAKLKIQDALSTLCIDMKAHEVMDDQMVSNSAFLLNRNKKEQFEQVIDLLDDEYKGLLNFKIVGPLPCYSFYTIEIEELNPEEIENARKILGLNGETTRPKIKKAYLENTVLFHPDTHPESYDLESFNKINKAYYTLLDYTAAAMHSSKYKHISLTRDKVLENLILVKIKE
jgi:hypothetical protein